MDKKRRTQASISKSTLNSTIQRKTKDKSEHRYYLISIMQP